MTDENGSVDSVEDGLKEHSPEGIRDELPDPLERDPHPDEDASGFRVGAGVGGILGRVIRELALFVAGFVREFTTFVPYGPRLWRGVMLLGAYNYQKSMGADAIALSHYQKSVVPEPVSYKLPEKVGDRPGWRVHGSKRHYDGGSAGGKEVMRMGKADVVMIDVDNPFTVTPFEARFAEALDLDNVRPLLSPGAILRQTVVELKGDADALTDPEALADGGMTRYEYPVELDAFDHFSDDVVDLSSQSGSDGMYVSAKKVKETYQETSTVEEMILQEERGKAAMLDKKELRAFMWKVFLVGAALAAVGIVGRDLIYAIFGAEQVGSVIPGVVSVLPSLGVM